MNLLRPIGHYASRAQTATTTEHSAPQSRPAWYVNRDAVPVRSGPGADFRALGQLFYLDRGAKLGESDGWVELRLRYRSASGLPAGTTAWIPATCASSYTP